MARALERPETLYDADLVAWLEAQVAQLRAGRADALDVANLIEELEAMAGSRRRALKRRLRALVMHLLKWDLQPRRCSRSRASTIVEQRARILDLLEESPSLRRELDEAARGAYPMAVRRAMIETGLPRRTFPPELPYDSTRILSGNEGEVKD